MDTIKICPSRRKALPAELCRERLLKGGYKARQPTLTERGRSLYRFSVQHSAGFLRMVEAARPVIHEVTVEEARQRLAANPAAILLDVREDTEWVAGHAREAVHLGRGILERDLEGRFPDPETEIIMYCGGGYRSALAAESSQRMGYKNVHSLIGGYKGMVAAGWPMIH